MEMINDILSDISKDPNKLNEHRSNKLLRFILEAAYIPEKKWVLPEGTPPYKELLGTSAQHSNGFWMVAKKCYVYNRPELKAAKRESLFIQDLEILSKEEAAILVAVKDQTLDKLYPNLTETFFETHNYFKEIS